MVKQIGVVVTECTEDSDPEPFARDCSDSVQHTSFLLCSTQTGESVTRRRRWTYHVDTDEWVLAEDVQDLLQDVGRRSPEDCLQYWCMDEDVGAEEANWFKKHRVLPVDGEITWFDLLNASQRQHDDEYAMKMLEQVATAKADVECNWIFDLDQKPSARNRIIKVESDNKGVLRTTTGHSCWWSTLFMRWLWALELMLAHGVPISPELLAQLGYQLPIDFAELIRSEVLSPLVVDSLAGNGWVLSQAGLVLMWLLSSLEHRTAVEVFDRWCQPKPECDDDDGDESIVQERKFKKLRPLKDISNLVFELD